MAFEAPSTLNFICGNGLGPVSGPYTHTTVVLGRIGTMMVFPALINAVSFMGSLTVN